MKGLREGWRRGPLRGASSSEGAPGRAQSGKIVTDDGRKTKGEEKKRRSITRRKKGKEGGGHRITSQAITNEDNTYNKIKTTDSVAQLNGGKGDVWGSSMNSEDATGRKMGIRGGLDVKASHAGIDGTPRFEGSRQGGQSKLPRTGGRMDGV